MEQHEYKNKNAIKFEIEIHSTEVTPDSDYFGYLFKVSLPEEDKDLCRIYKAMVRKSFCSSEEDRMKWLNNTALEFLKTILDTYQDGKTDLLVPLDYPDWVLI